jgi:hypothetical protein
MPDRLSPIVAVAKLHDLELRSFFVGVGSIRGKGLVMLEVQVVVCELQTWESHPHLKYKFLDE